MAIVTLGHILDWAQAFEKQIETYYTDVRDRTPDNGVRLLTYYIARHRHHQLEALASIPPPSLADIRAVELKFGISFRAAEAAFLSAPTAEHITGDGLIEAAIAFDNALVSIYRAIQDQPLGNAARTLIDALIRLEERDLVMLKKMLAMHYF